MQIVEITETERSLRKKVQRSLERRRDIIAGVLVGVDYTDSPLVIGKPGFVWFREWSTGGDELGGVIPVFNPGAVQNVIGIPVLVARAPRPPWMLQIIGTNVEMMLGAPDYNGQPFDIGPHGPTHTFLRGRPNPEYGSDVAYITSSNLRDCLVYPTNPTSMKCFVSPGDYIYRTQNKRFGGSLTADFTGQIPGVGLAKLACICIDGTTNALAYLYSATFPWLTYSDAVPSSALIAITPGYVLISAIILYNAMTVVDEKCFTYEMRPLFHAISDIDELGDLSDVASATPTAGNLLEADGTDWHSVAKGSIDVADFDSNASPYGYVPVADGASGVSWGWGSGGEPIVDRTPDIVYSRSDILVTRH